MFSLETITYLTVLSLSIASFDFTSHFYKKWKDVNITFSKDSIKAITTSSGVECAMRCSVDENCCTSSFDMGSEQCGLFFSCCPPTKQDNESEVLIRMSVPAINRVLNPLPKDCSDLRRESCSDVYIIQPFNSLNITVFCEMETDAGGWTIIQTRFDGSINFFRSWNDYKKGFGDVAGEHWIGNDNLHNILQQRTYKVRFDLEDFTGDTAYAIYDTFNIGDEGANYNLSISGYNGTAGHSVRDSNNISHEGVEFTTKDRDNDFRDINCADGEGGGWWYGACTWSNINGLYNVNGHKSIHWHTWRGKTKLRKTKMMIKPN